MMETDNERMSYSSSSASSSAAASSLATKAIRASSAHRDSSLSSAYTSPPVPTPPKMVKKAHHENTSMKSLNEPKRGFWGNLASKAKALLDEDHEPPTRMEEHNNMPSSSSGAKVRLQLETLLAEKARLAHENSIYTRENLYLRGVVKYHQLTMQNVVYFGERTEEVTEVYPVSVVT